MDVEVRDPVSDEQLELYTSVLLQKKADNVVLLRGELCVVGRSHNHVVLKVQDGEKITVVVVGEPWV